MSKQAKDLRQHGRDLTRPLHAAAETDPDLARLVDAWPTLPPHIKAAVLALVATNR